MKSIECLNVLIVCLLVTVIGSSDQLPGIPSNWQCVNESTLTYAANGYISFTDTLITCLQNINDPLIFPGFFTNKLLTVYSQVSLNNLIQVDELDSSVRLDFYFRLYWTDPRLNMSALWNVMPNQAAVAGVDVSQILGIPNVNGGDQPGIWLPDIFFPDAVDQQVTNYLLRLHPNGYMEWSRHFTITLLENSFTYQDYPNDEQTIVIRYNSYGLNSSYLVIQFQPVKKVPTGIVLQKNYNNQEAFTLNQIWKFKGNFSRINLEYNGNNRYRSTGVSYVYIARQPSGLVMRLGLPIFLLVILAAFVFWAARETRSDSTTSLLLAVSALYIVVFANIPMLGYLTHFDSFVLIMFGMLFGCAVIHQNVSKLDNRVDELPLRGFLIMILEAFGKVFIIPLCLFLYFLIFHSVYSKASIATAIVAGSIYFITMGYLEGSEVMSSYRSTIRQIENKIKDNDELDPYEILFFNWITYGILKSTLNHHEKKIQHDRMKDIELTNKNDNNVMFQRDSMSISNSIYLTDFNGVIDSNFSESKSTGVNPMIVSNGSA
mmetsp:Transcript_24513/g.22271  ORF Transcript_24513/g.22271 Transcript_24513/m.22271 type:complete len:546 (+) Transcript_24513:42-1679(+)